MDAYNITNAKNITLLPSDRYAGLAIIDGVEYSLRRTTGGAGMTSYQLHLFMIGSAFIIATIGYFGGFSSAERKYWNKKQASREELPTNGNLAGDAESNESSLSFGREKRWERMVMEV
jgi:hypothetical protein